VISHIGPLFLPKPPSYDPVRDFTPVSAAAESISALVVNAGSPFATVNDIVAEAKRSPGKLTYSSAGVGSAFHLTGELFKQAAGVDIVHVPYKGANQALADLLNGNITMTFAALGSLIPFAKSGKIKYVAILQSQRYAGLPNIPTVKEALPAFFRPDSSLGFFAPAALPAPVLTRLNAEIVKAINAPDVREKFDRDGLTPIGNSPAEFAAMVKSAIEGYAQAIKAAGFKPE
jgi:tripartite-type tricarboxylate transporter receptor subunit TctC